MNKFVSFILAIIFSPVLMSVAAILFLIVASIFSLPFVGPAGIYGDGGGVAAFVANGVAGVFGIVAFIGFIVLMICIFIWTYRFFFRLITKVSS